MRLDGFIAECGPTEEVIRDEQAVIVVDQAYQPAEAVGWIMNRIMHDSAIASCNPPLSRFRGHA